MSTIRPSNPSRPTRIAAALVRGVVRVPGLRRVLLWPGIARPGFWVATGLGYAWGWILFGRHEKVDRLHVFSELPSHTFGRGGTTIGAVYLTKTKSTGPVLEHEDVHRMQWRRYGLTFPVLYLAAGADPFTNRFEVDADLGKGGYRRRGSL